MIVAAALNPAVRRARMLAFGALAVVVAWSGSASASLRSQVLYARGLVPFHEGQWEQAFTLFDEAVAADGTDALALYYRGLAQARRGSNEAAIADIRQALQIEPRLPNAPLDLGIALFDQGQFADAQRALQVALDRGESPASAAFFLGLCAYRLGNYEEATAKFTQAGEDPGLRQSALYYSGLAKLRAGDTAEAQRTLRLAADEQPDSEIGRLAARFAASPTAAVEAVQADAGVPWSVYFETRLEYDSNVTIGASDGVDGTEEAGDGRPVLLAGGSYRFLSLPQGTLTGGADVGQSVHFSERDFDLSSLRLRLDWAGAPVAGRWSYGAGGGYEFYGLDYGAFSQSFLMQPWAAFHETPETATQAYWRFRYRDFLDSPFDPFRDGFNNAVGLRQLWLPLPRLLTHIGYQFDAESPEDTGASDPFLAYGADDFQYLGHQLDIGADAPWEIPYFGETVVRGGYRFRLDDYTNGNSRTRGPSTSGDGTAREDLEHTLALQLAGDLGRQTGLTGGTLRRLELSVGLIALFNDSNIAEFEYNRIVGTVGLQAAF
jgi:tetratricopeptide (TPR) repeat protein